MVGTRGTKRPLDRMTRDDFVDADGKLSFGEEGYALLRKLCEIVINTHYPSAIGKIDLMDMGVDKCLRLLVSGKYDPNRALLKNFLYTGVRNDIGNYLHRARREVCYTREMFEAIDGGTSGVEADFADVTVEEAAVEEVLTGLGRMAEASCLRGYLSQQGFTVPGRKTHHADMRREGVLVLWAMRKRRVA